MHWFLEIYVYMQQMGKHILVRLHLKYIKTCNDVLHLPAPPLLSVAPVFQMHSCKKSKPS